MHIVRGHTTRPFNPVLVVVLLDDRRHRAPRPDSVAAHDQRLLLAVLVEEGRLERGGIMCLELEDVTDLDGGLEAERAAAVRAGVAFPHLPNVREVRLE